MRLFTILAAVLFIGILIRIIFVNDMEYKEDEEYDFNQTQTIGVTQPWPWYGIASGVYGCGLLLTLAGVVIRRYYMAVTFPLEFICLIRMAGPTSRIGRNLLVGLWISELVVSASFVHYIHINEGSVFGDYGKAYHLTHPK